MTWVLPAASLAMSAFGAIQKNKATRKAATETDLAAQFEASQLDQRAKDTEAVGSYRADRIASQVKKVLSTQRAVAATNGTGGDQSTLAVQADSIQNASLDQIFEMAAAKDSASKDRIQAYETRRSGKAQAKNMRSQAKGQLLADTGSIIGQAMNVKWGS